MMASLAHKEKIKQTLLLQYPYIDFNLSNFSVDISRKTKRIKNVLMNDTLLFSLRTSDGRLLPTMAGGEYLLNLNHMQNRVYVSEEAEPFIADGKSAYCKHILKVDDYIYPESEVFLISVKNELLAIGTAIQPGYAMLELNSGIAVKSKHHY